jgi:hypothetical protein
MDEHRLEELFDNLNWIAILREFEMSNGFMERNHRRMLPKWFGIVMSGGIPDDKLERWCPYYQDNWAFWTIVTQDRSLSEEFILKHIDDMRVDILSHNNSHLSEEFLDRIIDKLIIYDLCESRELSESFIERNLEHLEPWMQVVCQCQILSEEFMYRHADILNWEKIACHQSFTHQFLEDFREHMQGYDVDRIEKRWAKVEPFLNELGSDVCRIMELMLTLDNYPMFV